MQLGMIGLGRMGANMVRRLMRAGHECVVFDMNPEAAKRLSDDGAIGTSSIEEFIKQSILALQNDHKEEEIAEILGISRKNLWEKRKRWGLDRPIN